MIADQDEYVGRFVAIESVEVRARVSGYLYSIHFRDGQTVRKGDLLFTIDRRPFETSQAQAQASLEQAKANLAFADADLNVANAAHRMHVHPNTVRYRLQQIATKTGHDPRTFMGLVELLCILEITDTQAPALRASRAGAASM